MRYSISRPTVVGRPISLNDQVFTDRVSKVSHPMRNFYLLRGPLDVCADFSNDPSYWWPDDRAWCLSTDTDFYWSYLAGTRKCIDEVLAVPLVDAVETKPENPARSGMDMINNPKRDRTSLAVMAAKATHDVRTSRCQCVGISHRYWS